VRCPRCGFEDNPQWRNGFDFKSEYMRFDEALNDACLKLICEKLKDKANFDPVDINGVLYYRRGSSGMFLYRVMKEDFRVPVERKNHKVKKA
jgi:hypothetical protein